MKMDISRQLMDILTLTLENDLANDQFRQAA